MKAGGRPVDGAHYPQGLVSCLYRLQSRLPVDFDLHAHGKKRARGGTGPPERAVGERCGGL